MEPKKSIAVVEDEIAISKLITYVLESAGFQVRAIFDGGEALEKIKENPPDLVLLDLMLPTISGFELLSRLKGEPCLNKLPVIVLTCRGQDEDKDKAFRLGALEYVTKPFSPTGLVTILKNILSSGVQ
ncbi:MAG: response regulator [Caldisericales bacterium]|jgi:DNA-binding response OmpR family regulator|nr:response regulator [Caldisericia bacterium]MCE5176474.1 response regulator [bacterium]NMD14625.1 response regulator [Caldisericales bacterium]